ncbi:MAG: choice-of-anchor D domain-containing protein [Chloroflexi bacterium]|nr:MAG: choice-of-anchor D domain-containing protein [Chloroflexota bacterium]
MPAGRGLPIAVRAASGIAAGSLLALAVLSGHPVGAAAAGNPAGTSDQATAYQVDGVHGGALAHDTVTPPLTRGWSVNLGAPVSYPLIANGHVFVTAGSIGTGAKLYALSLGNGSIAWGPVSLGGTYPVASAAYDAGRVFTVNYSGQMRAFNEYTGTALWTTELPGQYAFSSPPTAVNGIVYTGGAGSGGTVYAVRESDGALLWTGSVMNGDNSSPAVTSAGVYVSYACGQSYDFDPVSGALLWHHSTDCSGGGGKTPVLANGQLYVRDASSGNVVLDPGDGHALGSFTANRAPAISGARGFFLNNSTLTAIDLNTNTTLWTFTGDGALSSAPIVVNGFIYVGSTNGNLYAIDPTGNQVWTANVGQAISAPDEQNVSQPLTGLGAGYGYLLVPAGNTLNLYGGQEALYPGDANWGDQKIGRAAFALHFTLVDNSLSQLQLSGLSASGDYSLTSNCPVSLSPGMTCDIAVTFTPSAAGVRTGTLTLTDNAAGSPHTVPLSGTGVTAVLGRIVVNPSAATITAGGSQFYQAEAYDTDGLDLGDVTAATSFVVVPGGSCSGNACTASQAGSNYSVTGTYSGVSSQSALTVSPGPFDHLTISPVSATISAGHSQNYTVFAVDQYGNVAADASATTFAISPDGACSGTGSASCTTTTAGTHTVTASLSGKSVTSSLTVNPGSVTRVQIAPVNPVITAGASQPFTATTVDAYGNLIAEVTPNTAFGITPSGSCSANTCSATGAASLYTVLATYSGITDSTSLSVNPGPFDHVTISPTSATTTAGFYQSFSGFAVDQYGNPTADASAMTWAITPDGNCTSPGAGASCTSTKAGPHTVTATLNGKSATASLQVNARSATHIRIAPVNPTITAGSSQTFTATTMDGYENPVADVTSATTFAISPSGSCSASACTATQAGSNYTVTATVSGMSDLTYLTVNAGPFDHLTISPASSVISAGQYQGYIVFAVDQFGNVAADASGTSFAITPDGTCGGTGSATCTITQAGPHTVTASLSARSVTASLTVNPGPVSRIRLAPTNVTMAAGSSQAFSSRTVDAYGNAIADLTSSTSFAFSPNGICSGNVCTAPTQATTNANVIGTYNGMTDLVNVIVSPGPLHHLAIAPTAAIMTAGQSQAFSDVAYDQYNNYVAGGNVTNASTFAITPDGSCTGATCTATQAGSHTVTATFQGKTASASLAVNPGPATALTVSPTTLTLAVGQTATLTAAATDAYGNPVSTSTATWSLSATTPGTVSPASGSRTTFAASPTVSNTGQVRATMGTLTASSAVSVVPAAPTRLVAAASGGDRVKLSWSPAAGAASYTVYRSSGTTGWVAVGSGVTPTSFTDTNLKAGQTYSYYVIAVSSGGLKSAPSNTASVTVKN